MFCIPYSKLRNICLVSYDDEYEISQLIRVSSENLLKMFPDIRVNVDEITIYTEDDDE